MKVIEPQILKQKYDEALDLMIENRQKERTFVYKNIFEPNQKTPNQ